MSRAIGGINNAQGLGESMKAFGGLQRLFSDKVDGFAPIDDPFVRPDREETARSMELVRKGKEQGALNLPPSDATHYDAVEREIIAEVKEHLNLAHIDAGNHIRSYENRLASLHVLYGLSSIRGEKAKMRNPDFESARTNLSGVRVELWMLQRPDFRDTQPYALPELWNVLLQEQGALSVVAERISG